MVQYPKIGGKIPSWANLHVSLSPYGGPTFQTEAFAAIDWDEKLDPEKVPGTGPMHIGRTDGVYDANASMTMYLDSHMQFLSALQDIAGPDNGYGGVEFDLQASYEPLNGSGGIWTVRLIGARIAGGSGKNAPGASATAIDTPLSIDRVEKITPQGKVLRLI